MKSNKYKINNAPKNIGILMFKFSLLLFGIYIGYVIWHYNHRTLDEIKQCQISQLDYVREIKIQKAYESNGIKRKSKENKLATCLLKNCTFLEILDTAEMLED